MNIPSDITEPHSAKTTIALISNQEEILCTEPVYLPRNGHDSPVGSTPSSIAAQPRTDLRFAEICYILLKSGLKPVVVTLQKNGSIHIDGAYVDDIAGELKLTPLRQQTENGAWTRALDDGWKDHGLPPEEQSIVTAA